MGQLLQLVGMSKGGTPGGTPGKIRLVQLHLHLCQHPFPSAVAVVAAAAAAAAAEPTSMLSIWLSAAALARAPSGGLRADATPKQPKCEQ